MSLETALLGRLARDAETKISAKGKSYLRLTVVTGEAAASTWISVMAFDGDALANADKFVKGSAVYVEGKLSLNEWIAQDGTKRSGLSVLAGYCRLSQIGRNKPPKDQASERRQTSDGPLELQRNSRARQAAPRRAAGNDFYSDEIPF